MSRLKGSGIVWMLHARVQIESWSDCCNRSPDVTFDLMATARNSLHGELGWGLEWEPLISSGGVRQLPSVRELADPLPSEPANPPDPDPAVCGKYPPGEGSPSGPKPGLKLRTRAGGLQR